jgi:hypothetical protein
MRIEDSVKLVRKGICGADSVLRVCLLQIIYLIINGLELFSPVTVAELPRDCGLDVPSYEEEGTLPILQRSFRQKMMAWLRRCAQP